MSKKIEKNMIRERAEKLPEVTDAMWKQVDEEHKNLFQEYIDSNSFRPKSRKQYTSALRQWFYWVEKNLGGKKMYEISKRDFLRYISFLKNRGMSSSGIGLKKATVSSFCNYIENIVADDDKRYEKFRNFTRGLPSIPKTQTYDKKEITKEEFDLMMEVLEKDENLLGIAWLGAMWNIGCRKAELPQIKTSVLFKDLEGKKYVKSNRIVAKGKGEGKQVNYYINLEAIKHMKQWVENRGYEHEYVFTTTYHNEVKRMSESWADYFCSEVLSPIVGRRINPHSFKSSLVTRLLSSGMKPEIVSKKFAQHESLETTAIYDLRDFEDELDDLEW